jgi:hypothetical protein
MGHYVTSGSHEGEGAVITIDMPGTALRDGDQACLVTCKRLGVWEAELSGRVGYSDVEAGALLDLAGQLEHLAQKIRATASVVRAKGES